VREFLNLFAHIGYIKDLATPPVVHIDLVKGVKGDPSTHPCPPLGYVLRFVF
jgi:hypothetical protein